MGLKNGDHMQQQIAKIGSIQFPQTRLILIIDLCAAIVKGARLSTWHLGRCPRSVFPVINDPRHLPRGPAFFVDIVDGQHLFDQANLIIRVQNGEIAFQPHQFRVTAQKLNTDRMERAHPRHAFDSLSQ